LQCYGLAVIVKLPFGEDAVAVDLRGLRVRALRPSAPPGHGDVARLVAATLDRPVEGPPLVERARNAQDATVVVPDATRAVGLPTVLPAVLARLARAGVDGSRTTVLVACGTHPAVSERELASLVGPLPDGVRVVQHDARDDESLVPLGATAAGVPIRIHRLAATAGLLVTVGGVRHHYFAGFGGGPKMIFPGVAGYREIQANHARVLRDRDGRLEREPGCEPGVLSGNPIAEEIAAAADLRPPDCALCLVAGSGGTAAFAAAGPGRAAFDAAVVRARQWYEVPSPGGFPLAVASAGGRPSDSTLIQAHKALDAACRFLEPGGELLMVADLSGGSGSADMEPFLVDPRPEAIIERLKRGWVQYGHTTLRIVDKTARYRIHLVYRLDAAVARRLGFIPVEDPATVVDGWRRALGGETVAVLAGPAVYPKGPNPQP
jgi:nickel-dependent lactate racemase